MYKRQIQYNRVKPWQIYAWSIHDVVANCFLFLMNFVLYLAIGEYAILTTTISLILTGIRILDGITDPIIAYIVERTDSK